MTTVRDFPSEKMQAAFERIEARTKLDESEVPLKGKGGPPDNGDMEARVAALEAAVKHLATKEDLARLEIGFHKEINAQTWKLVTFVCGFGTALVAATYFLAKHVP